MTVNVTLTFPEPVLEWIDMERGEIKRSTYVIRLLQQTHENKKQNLKKLPQGSQKVGAHRESFAIVESKPLVATRSDSEYE
jgi:hypothetical protein